MIMAAKKKHALSFPKATSKYGAQMGRAQLYTDERVDMVVGQVPIDEGGYDPGGAYWGKRPPGLKLFMAESVRPVRIENEFWPEDEPAIARVFADASRIGRAAKWLGKKCPNARLIDENGTEIKA